MTNKEKITALQSGTESYFKVRNLDSYFFMIITNYYGDDDEFSFHVIQRVDIEYFKRNQLFGNGRCMNVTKIKPSSIGLIDYGLLDQPIKASIKVEDITIINPFEDLK